MTDDDIDDLRAQTRGSDRIDTEAEEAADETDGKEVGADAADAVAELEPEDAIDEDAVPELDVAPTDGFDDAVARAVDRARTGVLPRSYSGDDPAYGGLFEALRERPEDAERVARALAAAAGEEPPESVDKATLVDLAVAAGLRAAAPSFREPLDD